MIIKTIRVLQGTMKSSADIYSSVLLALLRLFFSTSSGQRGEESSGYGEIYEKEIFSLASIGIQN